MVTVRGQDRDARRAARLVAAEAARRALQEGGTLDDAGHAVDAATRAHQLAAQRARYAQHGRHSPRHGPTGGSSSPWTTARLAIGGAVATLSVALVAVLAMGRGGSSGSLDDAAVRTIGGGIDGGAGSDRLARDGDGDGDRSGSDGSAPVTSTTSASSDSTSTSSTSSTSTTTEQTGDRSGDEDAAHITVLPATTTTSTPGPSPTSSAPPATTTSTRPVPPSIDTFQARITGYCVSDRRQYNVTFTWASNASSAVITAPNGAKATGLPASGSGTSCAWYGSDWTLTVTGANGLTATDTVSVE
jgi:hypothetical protein